MSKNSFSISEFLKLTEDEFIGKISENHATRHTDLLATQTFAWKKEYKDLQNLLQGRSGRVIFEYSIPSLQKTIDVVLLIQGKIFVLEYKVNAEKFNHEDIIQTNGYALRLKFFHSNSNDNWIIPILIATNNQDNIPTYERSEEDFIYKTIKCNSNNLKEAIEHILSITPDNGSDEWENGWENGFFKASSSIIDAAKNVWEKNNVRDFSIGESSVETRLAAEDYIVNHIVKDTQQKKEKSICFITGVPGAGKTLVGLNISVRLQEEGASLLSGNGPLVRVLSEVLEKDLDKQEKKGRLVRPRDKISIDTIIKSAHSYRSEILNKRANYIEGEGKLLLKDRAKVGDQHVIIFDEAQRAWNKSQLIKRGLDSFSNMKEKAFPYSEAGLLLWDMNQRDWGVFVCLVGGGQEINTGEAGICEWLRTIKEHSEFSNWHIYMSKELLGDEYNGRTDGGMSLSQLRNYFIANQRLTDNESLHLTESMRSIRSNHVSAFVHELLDGNTEKAKQLYNEFKDKYHIYLTRDINRAKEKLRERKKDLGGIKDEELRIGMLMSSTARRLRPLGYEIKKVGDYLSKVPNWFLQSSNHIDSSNFLEVALSEFFVQGLELDLAAVVWDADFRYNSDDKVWNHYKFYPQYHKWCKLDKNSQEIERFYMKNAYRVLLTRARFGMVIVVPEGDPVDTTRKSEFYKSTYDYLKSIGLKDLDK